MRRRGGIAQRMILASVMLGLVIGGAFATLLVTIEEARSSDRRARHSQDVLLVANDLEERILALETGQRGFLLTRQTQFLLPWQQARAALPQEGRSLLALVEDDHAQAERVRRIVNMARAYVDEYSLPLITAAERGDPAARTVAATAEGDGRVTAMQAEFDALLHAQRRTSDEDARKATRSAHRAYAGAAFGIAASVALVALYAGYLTRAIVRPVRRAAALAGRLATGDLGARLPVTSIGEISQLEHSFNTMAATLEQRRDELAASRARLIVTADETRRRFERDLHDGAQQKFVTAALLVRKAQAAVPSDAPALRGELDEAVAELEGAIDELRDFAQGIHPVILTEGGLGPALRKLARQSAVPVQLDVTTNGRLPAPVEVATYYVVSEALANAAKHGHASVATVHVEADAERLRLDIHDDGVGGARFGRGSGLVGLKDRVEALGGTISLQSEPNAGTSLRVELPLEDAGS